MKPTKQKKQKIKVKTLTQFNTKYFLHQDNKIIYIQQVTKFCDDFQYINQIYFPISNNRMNLSADQYLNMIDQMTKLRLQNQRNQRDKALLAEQVQKQKIKLQQLSSNNTIVSTANPDYGNRPDYDRYNRDVRKFNKTADDYIEDFKNSITSMQNKICQFIATNGSEQMKQIKNQIIKIKDDIKPIIQDLPKEKENKQNPFSINLKQCKQRTDSKRLHKVSFENKENKIPENNTVTKQMQKQKQKEVEEFYKKVKFIYGLWNKDKKQPSLQELYVWVNKINAQSSNLPLKDDFNPIQAAKKARSQKKLITFNNIGQQNEKKEKSHQKSSKRLHQRDLDSQNQYQKQTQNYFHKYIQPNKNRQSHKQIGKKNEKNSNETTKKSDKADEQEQFSPMPPKNNPQPRKSKENIPLKRQTNLSKKNRLFHNLKNSEKNPNNASEAKENVHKANSKKNIPSKSKIQNQNKNQRKSNKDIKGPKSLDPNAKKNGSKNDLNPKNNGSISKLNPPKTNNPKENVSPKPTNKNEKPGTNKKIDDKKPRTNSKTNIPDKKDPKDSKPKDKNNQNKLPKPRRESTTKK